MLLTRNGDGRSSATSTEEDISKTRVFDCREAALLAEAHLSNSFSNQTSSTKTLNIHNSELSIRVNIEKNQSWRMKNKKRTSKLSKRTCK